MNKKPIIVLLIIAFVILIAGCVNRTENIYKDKYNGTVIETPVNEDKENKENIKDKESTEAKHWTYEGDRIRLSRLYRKGTITG